MLLERCQRRLQTSSAQNPNRKGERWVDNVVIPRIGALLRKGQKLKSKRRGFFGSTSILRRSFAMWMSTVRVSISRWRP